jgi:hypothetical protein
VNLVANSVGHFVLDGRREFLSSIAKFVRTR